MSGRINWAMRYLGVREDDAQTLSLIEKGFAGLATVTPRHVTVALPTKTVNDAFQSRSLAAYLAGCDGAVCLAATLGAQADRLIRSAETMDMVYAAVLHACAAAEIEAYCDTVQASIPRARASRYSPGYGDLPLQSQKTLLDLTDAGRRIGLFLTDGYMLAPTKSITAVIGLGGNGGECHSEKCSLCAKYDCVYRKGEPPCE